MLNDKMKFEKSYAYVEINLLTFRKVILNRAYYKESHLKVFDKFVRMRT